MTTSHAGSSWRRSSSSSNLSSVTRKKTAAAETTTAVEIFGGGGQARESHSLSHRRSLSSSRSIVLLCVKEDEALDSRNRLLTGERTVKRLRLSRALTVPETTTVKDACRRMAARRVDALLLTDSNALLCGILTDKDILTRVVARELNLEETPVSRIMTRNPVFVLSDTLAVEALQKMVQGKFRHLPVVENGEVIALLDITKCLYDAIARMERAADNGKAIAAAVEGVWGTSVSGPNTFMETLRERIFKPSLSTIMHENSKVVTVDRSDTVLVAAKKILESGTSSAIVTVENKPCGILTSKDMLMRVVAHNLPPESTLVEKVMTQDPQCATVNSPLVDALHIMHEGRFLHLPVVGKDGMVVTVVDVLQITHAALETVGSTNGVNCEVANAMVQKFWDSAMEDEEETHSKNSFKMNSDGGETGQSLQQPSSIANNGFAFKFQDRKGCMHRLMCDTDNMADLMTAILRSVGAEIDRNNIPQILYEDEDKDKVVLASDSDLQAAIYHARLAGWKELRLHFDYSGTPPHRPREPYSMSLEYAQADSWASAYSAAAAGAVLMAGLALYVVLRKAKTGSWI